MNPIHRTPSTEPYPNLILQTNLIRVLKARLPTGAVLDIHEVNDEFSSLVIREGANE